MSDTTSYRHIDCMFLSNHSFVSVRLCVAVFNVNVQVFVQAELPASLSNVNGEHLAQSSGRCRLVSMEIGHESVTDTPGSQMKPEPAEMEVNHDAELSTQSSTVGSLRVVEELNATMNHTIDTKAYPFPSEPDDNQLNASIMIDPSNPFDEDMIARVLSKLSQPLNSYKNCHYVNALMPKICVRGSVQLGMFLLYSV